MTAISTWPANTPGSSKQDVERCLEQTYVDRFWPKADVPIPCSWGHFDNAMADGE